MATRRNEKEREPAHADTQQGTLDELWKLVEGIETAMLTTRRADGHMVSRPMATQKRASGADFWFATMDHMPKVAEISREPRVNLAYYKDRTREWVSVSGEAFVSRDRSEDPRALGARLEILVSGRGRRERRRPGGPADRADRSSSRLGAVHDAREAAGAGPLRSREGEGDGQDSGDGRGEEHSPPPTSRGAAEEEEPGAAEGEGAGARPRDREAASVRPLSS